MTGREALIELGADLARRAGANPPAVYDIRIDHEALGASDNPALLVYVRHQALLRSYQGRYILLPPKAHAGSILDRLKGHYDPRAMMELDRLRADLEDELITPLVEEARSAGAAKSCADYIACLVPSLAAAPPNEFVTYVETTPEREHHYRNFLVQSSVDLLAEASASALGVIGEFGEPQSALFRILIDEFGYGTHAKKHSVLYRSTLGGFGLDQEYNAYWPLFDTPTLELHNVIHFMFQSPRNLFLQIGFLLYAEAAYQRSTSDHFRYLKRYHPGVDAHYFGEHAHIDIHHATMIAKEVAAPLVAKFGEEVGSEIVTGAELTRLAFERAGNHMLAVSRAFEAASQSGQADFGMQGAHAMPGRCRVPGTVVSGGLPLQIGGIGCLTDAAVFATFPEACVAREIRANG